MSSTRAASCRATANADDAEHEVPEVACFDNFRGEVGEGAEDVVPPPAHALVPPIGAGRRALHGGDLNIRMGAGESRIEVTPVPSVKALG